MTYCYEHKKPVKLVDGWVAKKLGTKVLKKVCPKCYNLTHYQFKCQKCGLKNDYWAQKGLFDYRCRHCRDTGKVVKPRFRIGLGIPEWRLNIDDASPEEVMRTPLSEFGMPTMTKSQWDAFYSQEREVKKVKQFEEQRKKLVEEALLSNDSKSLD